jgi:hypothetical protein
MKKNIFFILLNLNLILNLSCSTTEPPIPPDETKPTLALALDDTSCTEVWLQLTTKDLTLPAELTLKQFNPTGDSVTQTFSLSTQDSLLYIDSLLPSQSYYFQVSSIESPVSPEGTSSNKQPVTTMDTTSHDFTFQSWTFGTIGSSTLYDVAIIDENNIWAVGEIMIADTSQNGYTTYNAVHWDGGGWTLHKLYFYTIPGQQDTGVYEARSILAFDENNIWITSGSQITKWDGIKQTNRHSSPVYVNKLWGTDNNNIYAVGYNGQIAHYNGTNWQRIESGTTLNINDIWGDFNEKTQEWEVLAVASNFGTGLEKEILQIKNNSVTKLPLSPQMWPLLTTWFISYRQYYVGGSGIYQKKLLLDLQWRNEALDITTFSTTAIRGNDINDVIAVGAFGDLLHFNGIRWKNDYAEPLLGYGTYGSVEIKNNLLIAVGDNYDQAVILFGVR